MKLQVLFPTPLWTTNCSDTGLLEGGAHVLLDLMAADPAGLSRTNHGSWHSKTDLLDEPRLANLFFWIATKVQRALVAWGWDLEVATPHFNNAWGVVSHFGHSHGAHLHPNSLFSGVLYLAVPPGSGAIVFLDPRAGSQILQLPLTSEASQRELGRHRLLPEAGLLLLFPAWLWHEVEVNACTDPRICISFNLGLRLSGTLRQDQYG